MRNNYMEFISTQPIRGWGIILVVHFAWDTRTWEMIGEPEVIRDYRVVATETANDPQTGRSVWGSSTMPTLHGESLE